MSEFDGGFVCDFMGKIESCDERKDCVGCPPYEFWAGRKPVLDPCCGPRGFYFDKAHPAVLYCDCRRVDEFIRCDGRKLEVQPDLLVDFTSLPFADEQFWHVVFDPPHLIHASENAWLVKKYGRLPGAWQNVLCDGFNECWRVLKTNGILIFKWSEYDIPVAKLLEVIGRQPLYGHRSGRKSKTHWLAFVKVGDEYGSRILH